MPRSDSFLIAMLLVPALAGAATLTVDSTDDDDNVNGNCTLREAIRAANTNLGVDECPGGDPGPGTVDRIIVPAGTYTLSLGPAGDDQAARGDLDLTDEVEIDGAAARTTVIDAAQLDRAFEIHSGVTATLSDLEIRGGNAAGSSGGGLRVQGGATVIVERCTLDGNTADLGGGIRNNGTVTVVASTLSGNNADADHGGGIDNHGTAFFENSTVSGNSGGTGGGLYNNSGEDMTLLHTTVVGNSAAGAGSAILNLGQLSLTNSLIEGPCSNPADVSGGGNLESPGDTCGLGANDQTDVGDPMLGPLADNGGGTDTHAPEAGSPAIDTGAAGPCSAIDQRGAPRPADGDGNAVAVCDIGAVEVAALLEGLIFTDGFENGDTLDWSQEVP